MNINQDTSAILVATNLRVGGPYCQRPEVRTLAYVCKSPKENM